MYDISLGELKSDFDKAWQYSQNEPVFISEQGQNRRVLLSFDEFVKMSSHLAKPHSPKSAPIKKSDYAGGLAEFANPELIPLEEQAVELAIKAKYGID